MGRGKIFGRTGLLLPEAIAEAGVYSRERYRSIFCVLPGNYAGSCAVCTAIQAQKGEEWTLGVRATGFFVPPLTFRLK